MPTDDPKQRMTDKTITRNSGLVERLCVHGVGHPTRESAERVANLLGHPVSVWLIHGCDGCCTRDK